MSGTVPINIENSLRRELCLGPNTVICWRLCNRPELIYNVEPPVKGNDHLDKRVLEIIGKLLLAGESVKCEGLSFQVLCDSSLGFAYFFQSQTNRERTHICNNSRRWHTACFLSQV